VTPSSFFKQFFPGAEITPDVTQIAATAESRGNFPPLAKVESDNLGKCVS
jgi:hypothetical protein